MTFKAAIATILDDDARLTDAGTLGDLMEYDATSRPDLVFATNAPQEVEPPKLTYTIQSQVATNDIQYKSRRATIVITAWANNFGEILARVFELLQKNTSMEADDFYCENILFGNCGPELFDDNLKCSYRADTYFATLVDKN